MLLGTKKELALMKVKNNPAVGYVGNWAAEKDTIKDVVEHAVANGWYIGKGIRSYTLFPPHLRLDHTKPWLGFEVETGFDLLDDWRQALVWVNEKTRGTTFDNEGSGDYPAEISFYPTHSVSSLERNCGPMKIITAIETGQLPKPAEHAPDDMIGTHFNMSTPFTRDGANRDAVEIMVSILGRACQNVAGQEDNYDDTSEDALLLFGRSPYEAPPFVRIPCYENNEPVWLTSFIEFKWFNTTYSKAQWFGYCVVMRWLIDYFSEDRSARITTTEVMQELRRIAAISATCVASGQPYRGEVKCLV